MTDRVKKETKRGVSALMIVPAGVCWLLVCALPAGATQIHRGPEGLYAHQMAHFFFAFSMGILIYWLKARRLTKEPGWRLVQYAAFFFILWNLDAMIVHYLDGRDDLSEMINAGSWHARISVPDDSFGPTILYYMAKMDHLLCVPAIVFLYAGLSGLLRQVQETPLPEKEP